MNLRQIEVFQAIMETGSITDAARLLFITAPAVSKFLAHTELQLGYPLFERNRGRLHPTKEARELYTDAQEIHLGVQRISRKAKELGQKKHGYLNIVASPSLGHMLVPLAIAYFKGNNPDIHVSYETLNQAHMKEYILLGTSDIGISTLPVEHPNLLSTPISRSRLLCICLHNHPLASKRMASIGEISPYPLVAYTRESPFRKITERLYSERGESMQIVAEVGAAQNACALVQAGAGIALVDEYSLQSWPEDSFCMIDIPELPYITSHMVRLRSESLGIMGEEFIRRLHHVLDQRGLAVTREVPSDFFADVPEKLLSAV